MSETLVPGYGREEDSGGIMKKLVLSLAMVLLSTSAVSAQGASKEITTPTEVGTTSMPAGNYIVTEQSSGKSYALMVSSKGTMILSPAPAGASAAVVPVHAPGSGGASAAAPGAQTAAAEHKPNSQIKNLMNKEIQKGALQLLNSGTGKQLKELIK